MESHLKGPLNDPYPVLSNAKSAVLLIFFMPAERANRAQRYLLASLADSLQAHFMGRLRVLRIDEANHPDIVQSFAVSQLPAFVLLRRGVELWRQEGMSDEATLIGLILDLLPEKGG